MQTVNVSLKSIDDVKKFVNTLTFFDCDFDLISGRYVIDAKSIMGIFSLDLSKPIELHIHQDGDCSSIIEKLNDFIVQ
ncbi:PTS HPr component phosphorylation site [Acetitomaculum ruminis DSM 5522]|uniref:PTS HPr component phosphorylation site n=1 Tax=Acetitomaculum ruminis DSM 5522 TaxID=1120918 RepID=A0A1I0ZH85_9FIRM|nr:HPr family phosphocarrier protein [Acetitomaculum ruminis]SFB24732.1 PTS HPr component phosphorylation site [Acetitomaculum ruminis DSM 5522]